ncbi:hypothetical protein C7S18_23740 (plasmid) [Ahniella affigens]|uniref:Uncharacterized protein n=1 Tax=Ahniella affigens TaxID=2021234 RepID=A0A2P1PZP6_9GAMM|nr:hypothetical protein C7S18_23740 [Ahniella affigens]
MTNHDRSAIPLDEVLFDLIDGLAKLEHSRGNDDQPLKYLQLIANTLALIGEDEQALTNLARRADRRPRDLQRIGAVLRLLLQPETFHHLGSVRPMDAPLQIFRDTVRAKLPNEVVDWLRDAAADLASFYAETGAFAAPPCVMCISISGAAPDAPVLLRVLFESSPGAYTTWARNFFRGVSPTFLVLASLPPYQAALCDNDFPATWRPCPLFRYHPERFRQTRHYARQLRSIHTRPTLLTEATANTFFGFIVQEHNERLNEVDRRETWRHNSSGMRILNDELTLATAWVNFQNAGRQIFEFPQHLCDMLTKTDASDIPVDLLRLPYPIVFLHFGAQHDLALGDGAVIDGVYVEHHPEHKLMIFRFTTIPATPEHANLWHGYGEPGVSITLEPDHAGLDLGTAIDAVTAEKLNSLSEERERAPEMQFEIDQIKDELELPAHIFVSTEARASRETDEVHARRPVVARAMHLAASAMCYLTAYPDDVETAWPEGTPPALMAKLRSGTPKQQTKAASQLESMGYTRVHLCGKRLADVASSSPATDAGERNVRPHWRRGHWRRQAYGEQRSLRKLIWLMPLLVHRDAGSNAPEPAGHIYRVDS